MAELTIAAHLHRIASRDDGMFGVLVINNRPICVTLEEAWRDNARRVSCIPAGRYLCRRVMSPKYGDVFEVTGVPGRDKILLHGGNVDDDTEGCILLAEKFIYWSDGSCAVGDSRVALQEFMAITRAVNHFYLDITEHFSQPARSFEMKSITHAFASRTMSLGSLGTLTGIWTLFGSVFGLANPSDLIIRLAAWAGQFIPLDYNAIALTIVGGLLVFFGELIKFLRSRPSTAMGLETRAKFRLFNPDARK